MAASNMKAVKLRMRSIESTMQITRAMQLVAASKLRKAKERADATRPTFKVLHDTLVDIAVGNTDFASPYTETNANEKWLYVVIAGDRGMAGGYNANVFRKMAELTAGKQFDVLPLGKKAVEYYRRRQVNIVTEAFAEVATINMGDCLSIADIICEAYKKGEYGHIAVCYTGFISMLTQRPAFSALLPLSDFWKEGESEMSYMFIELGPKKYVQNLLNFYTQSSPFLAIDRKDIIKRGVVAFCRETLTRL